MFRRMLSFTLALFFVLALGVSPAVAAGPKAPAAARPEVIVNYDRDGNRVADHLDTLLRQAARGDRFQVIVQFTGFMDDRAYGDLAQKLGAFTPGAKWHDALEGMSVALTRGQIEALSKLPMVARIEEDLPVQAFLDTATADFGAAKARTDFGVTGNLDGSASTYSKNDLVIAVVDTGIDAAHQDLAGKVIGWQDYVNAKTSPYDDNGHGTHVSSIAAGTGAASGGKYAGVAPGAALVGVKVLNKQGSGTTTQVVNGINWVIQNKATYNIRIMSMSLGSSGSSDGTDSISVAVNNTVNSGIASVVAAGNSGPDTYTIGSPAAAADAITVGAMADTGEKGFSLASFSSRGPTADDRIKPDIAAPGVNITAAKAGTTTGYVTYSGTSMATPFVSGTVALMLSANGSLSPAQVKSLLMSTAVDWGPAGTDVDYGAGRLQAYEAVKQAGGFSGTGPAVPNHAYVSGSLSGTGYSKTYTLSVTDVSKPIALTMVITNYTPGLLGGSPDFDLYLYSPSGAQVAASEGVDRQETIGYLPAVTGTYTVEVYSYSGSGSFFLDESFK
ncbi:MAG: S8 family serine peptidase [Firmicutes bacterium]|nr:S8 family serine peptidase [Bacillota bacterium]